MARNELSLTRQPSPDWAAIRAAYAANTASLRGLGRQFGVSYETIRKRVASEGWDRRPRPDLRPAILAAKPAAADPANPKTIVERGRNLVLRLLDELDATTTHIGTIEAAILDETTADPDGRRRQTMLQAVSLSRRATILKDIATASRTLADTAPGKKEAAQEAAGRAATGRYAAAATPPKLVVSNRRSA